MLYFSAWKNQKIDQVNIANKFKGVQMQFLEFNKFAYIRYGLRTDAKSKA